MPFEITELELIELSIVDEPANPGARAVLFKRDDTKEIEDLIKGGMSEDEARDQVARMRREQAAGLTRKTGKKGTDMSEDVEKRLAKIEAENEKLAASVSTLSKALTGEGYVVEQKKGGDVSIEKRSDDDFIEVGGERVLKSAVPAGVLAAIEKQGKELSGMAETLEKAALEKRADSELGNLIGEVPAKGALLKAVDAIEDEETRKGAHEILASANKLAKSSLLKEHGRTTHEMDDEAANAQAKLEKLAKEYAADKGVSYPVAFAEVTKSGEGLELFNKRKSH